MTPKNQGIWQYLMNRLSEPSTWRGIVALLTATGLVIDPEQATAIVTVGVAVIGLIGAFLPDKPARKSE